MSKVYCKSDFKKLEKEFKIQRLQQEGDLPEGKETAAKPIPLEHTKDNIMYKIQKALTGLWQIIKNPWLLNHVLDEEVYWRKRVVKQYGFENGLPVIALEDLFPGFDETVTPYAFLDGSCLPTDLALLRALARKYKVGSYLEIGTWRGESVANVAPLVSEAVTINLPDNEMRAMGMTEEYIGLHRLFSKNLANVTHLQANSLGFDFSSLKKAFDMIFVDGDHHYEAVRSDSGQILKALNQDTGIVVWHDYARNPEQTRWSVLAGIIDGLPKEMHQHLYHVSNTMCAVYLPGLSPEIPRRSLNPNVHPGKYFELRLKTIKLKP
ncbi:MAG: class I SAM-dependent methyltransferase [Bacteroides sp.]|jgi:predicted O-methyltransferase YrrM|nr:class I SAM-dependent methyltransferase [Bacteroides sp.]